MVCIFEGPPINDYVSDDDDHHHVDHGNVTICNPFNYTRFNYDDIGMQWVVPLKTPLVVMMMMMMKNIKA